MWAFEDPDPEEGWARTQVVHVTMTGGFDNRALLALDEVLSRHSGGDAVVLHVEDGDRCWDMDLARRQVSHSPELMEAVEQLLGAGGYRAEVVRRKAPERKQWTPRPQAAQAVELEPEPDFLPVP